ncbi:MAG: trypsin-like peptidase domain-containing protein, partial [Cyanobacteria bacterium P01_G01_bin.49]
MLKKRHYLLLITSVGSLLVIFNAYAFLTNRSFFSPHQLFAQAQTQTPENLKKTAQNITVRVYAGDNSGSGVLIEKNGSTYTVITNAHVVKPGTSYRIQTPDGMTHTATLQTAEDALTGNDLALLQFDSTNRYNLATFASSDSLKPDQTVLAAGFPYNSSQLSINEGSITLITPKPMTGGYQIGFTNATEQGMSGGVLLNQKGQLIGIIGKGNAIFSEAYAYQDGTSPDENLLQEMQQANFAIPVEPVAFLAKLYEQQGQETNIPRQVNQIAAKITVRIDTPTDFDGSGVIIGRNQQTYYVLTARHVVEGLTKTQIITPDGKSHVVNKEGIKTFEGVDIGVVEFTSDETYQVATLGDYPVGNFKTDRAEAGFYIQSPLVFLSGFPMVKSGNPSRRFTSGIAVPEYENLAATKDQYSLSTGMELVYNALSLPGMSGGAVLDQQGRVIGINAGAEHEEVRQKEGSEEVLYLGNSLGVPIKTFLGQIQKGNLNAQWFKVETKAPQPLSSERVNQVLESVFTETTPTKSSSAVDWFNYGRSQTRMAQNETALKAYNEAIKRNPQFYQAYYAKGRALFSDEIGQYQEALAAFEKATEIEPDFNLGWYWQAVALMNLDKYSEALAALEKTIQDQPQEPKSYALQGSILAFAERDPEAEKAYTKAIKLKPNAKSYLLRGIARSNWGDEQGEIADYTKAIQLQPNLSNPYISRAFALMESNPVMALKDAEKAIELDPDYVNGWQAKAFILLKMEDYQEVIAISTEILDKFFPGDQETNNVDPYALTIVEVYQQISNAHWKLGNVDEAIAGYNKLIELAPNNAFNYHFRGLALSISQKSCTSAALADFNKAIEIQPDDPQFYNSRALCFEIAKNQDKAMADYQKVVEIATQKIKENPNNPHNY